MTYTIKAHTQGFILMDSLGYAFHGANHWECIDRFLCYHGG